MRDHKYWGTPILETGGVCVYKDGRNVNLVQANQWITIDGADLDEVIECLKILRDNVKP